MTARQRELAAGDAARRKRSQPGAEARQTRLQKAERGRKVALAAFVLCAIAATGASAVWGDPRQAIVALGLAAGAVLMLARPAIERRRTLDFAVPPGGAELIALPVACAAQVGLVRLAQVTAGTDNPPIYLFAAFLTWGVSIGAAWALSSLPPGEPPRR